MVFWYMWVPELLLPPKKIGWWAQKQPFLPQNMLSRAYISLAGSFGAMLVGWLVRGCCAGAVSRKTPIHLIFRFTGRTNLNIMEHS